MMQAEQRFMIHGVSWQTYVRLRDKLDTPGLRMTFCEGTLELTSPSVDHEAAKKSIREAPCAALAGHAVNVALTRPRSPERAARP